MLLVTGPPGSAKTHFVLEEVRRRLRGRRFDFRLIAPTATMAVHLQHLLAREGLVSRPSLVTTLARFTSEQSGVPPEVTAPVLDWLVARALEDLDLREFRRAAAFPGFRVALAAAFKELSLAGCDPGRLSSWREAQPLAAVYEHVRRGAHERGAALPGDRLAAAADQIRRQAPPVRDVFLDGFFHFNPAEIAVLAALRAHGDLTVTLPQAAATMDARRRLLELGLAERLLERVRPQPAAVLVRARTVEQEVEETAARILDSARPFREIGIVVRTRDPYVPLLRAALERFGIPAHFYFSSPWSENPRVRRWLAALASQDGSRTAGEWRDSCAALADAEEPRAPVEPSSAHSASLWRARSAAARAWRGMAEETAGLFDGAPPFPAARFHHRLEIAARLTATPRGGLRRNVVHVMDAVEARQWELPVVHVCGLIERQFPLYHAPGPILPEPFRRRLRDAGIPVQTSEDWDRDEKLIFEIAASRATEQLVLSHPECNAKGEETLPSFFLDRFCASQSVDLQAARPVRPAPAGPKPHLRAPLIRDEALLAAVARRHQNTTPSALEDFLQCPFQFFARHTLELASEPAALDARFQGNVAHTTLARWIADPLQPVDRLVNVAFRQACERDAIPDGYRTEAVRLELLRNLRRFVRTVEIAPDTRVQTERTLTLPLPEGVTLRCRIDRIDIAPDGRALIVDYKYSGPKYVADLVKAHAQGTRVQGGLYALALRASGQEVSGMVFVPLRNEPKEDGWRHDPAPVMEISLAAATRAVREIRAGVILPRPADSKHCARCEFRDVCRVESAPAALGAGGALE